MLDYDENSFITINQAYKIWKKHSPFLYNLLQTYQLYTCSQTIDWFSHHYLENDWNIHSLLIGTNSLAKNGLIVLTVALPTDDSITDYASYRDEAPEGEIGTNGFIGTLGVQQLNTKIFIPQPTQILKARINHLDQNFIAAKTGGASPQLLVYDLRNKESQLQSNVIKLHGHEHEGYGLAWNPLINGKLLSGSYDQQLTLYDINSLETKGTSWTASQGVEDVKWSSFDPHIFGSAQQDEKICIWDTRSLDGKPALSRKAHAGEVYSLDFNKKSEHLLLSGGQDSDVNFWDIRNLSKKLHSFVGHNDAVNVVAWNPKHSLQFASGSNDRRVVLWDIDRLNMNTKQHTGHQILFIHGGHRTKITDLSWGQEKELLASSEENSTLQVWKMNQRISSV